MDADGAAVEQDLALIGLDDPAQDLEERGFAGAVRADDCVDLGGGDVEADVADRMNAAVALRNPAKGQHVVVQAKGLNLRIENRESRIEESRRCRISILYSLFAILG